MRTSQPSNLTILWTLKKALYSYMYVQLVAKTAPSSFLTRGRGAISKTYIIRTEVILHQIRYKGYTPCKPYMFFLEYALPIFTDLESDNENTHSSNNLSICSAVYFLIQKAFVNSNCFDNPLWLFHYFWRIGWRHLKRLIMQQLKLLNCSHCHTLVENPYHQLCYTYLLVSFMKYIVHIHKYQRTIYSVIV